MILSTCSSNGRGTSSWLFTNAIDHQSSRARTARGSTTRSSSALKRRKNDSPSIKDESSVRIKKGLVRALLYRTTISSVSKINISYKSDMGHEYYNITARCDDFFRSTSTVINFLSPCNVHLSKFCK